MLLGIWADQASTFLTWLCAITTLVFALPITLFPLGWARLMRWRIPADTQLTVYFGRCLGLFILILEGLMARAAWNGNGLVWVFEQLVAVFACMVALHVYGALRRQQPWTETAEIGLYSVCLLLTLACFPLPAQP